MSKEMKPSRTILICIFLMLFLMSSVMFTGCQNAEELDHSSLRLDSLQCGSDGYGEATFDGVNHELILYLPDNYESCPLIVMLHGYGNSAEAMRTQVDIQDEANARGYAVVYVTGTAGGWNSGIGESEDRDVEFLCALSNELCDEYNFDSSRVYAVGYSNGAFMTHRLALEGNDTFAAVVSVAGMMPRSIWEARPEQCPISVFQITGGKDDVVPQLGNGSAQYSDDPAIEDVIGYYVEVNNLTAEQTSEVGRDSTLTVYSSDSVEQQVWNLYIPDGVHSWPDERFVEFNTNSLILDFLDAQ